MTDDPITPEEMIDAPLPAEHSIGEETPSPDAQEEKSAPEAELDEDRKRVIEALLFASQEPLPFRDIKLLLEGEAPPAPKRESPAEETQNGSGEENSGERETLRTPRNRRRPQRSGISPQVFRKYVKALNEEYLEGGRSFRIVEIAGGYAFQTTKEFAPQVGKMFAEKAKRRLTHSALETLAIVAFRQPISKPAIESIRGVNADFVLKSLLEKDLVTIVGRDPGVGRPLLYGTTDTFLKHFGIARIEDLPKPREIEELLAEEESLGVESIDMEEAESESAHEIGIAAEEGIFKTMPYGKDFEFEQAEEKELAPLPDRPREPEEFRESEELREPEAFLAVEVPLRVSIDENESVPAEEEAHAAGAADGTREEASGEAASAEGVVPPPRADDFEEEE